MGVSWCVHDFTIDVCACVCVWIPNLFEWTAV